MFLSFAIDENPSMRAVAKILRAGASKHSSNFCEQVDQMPNFAEHFQIEWDYLIPYLSTFSNTYRI